MSTRAGYIESEAIHEVALPFTGTPAQRRHVLVEDGGGKLWIDPTFGDLYVAVDGDTVDASASVYDYKLAAGIAAPVLSTKGQTHVSVYSPANWPVTIHEVK